MSEENEKPALLVVDDDDEIRTQMKWALAEGYDVHLAGSRDEALEVFRAVRPPVVTLDLGLPPHPRELEEGFKALSQLLEVDPLVKIVVITGRAEREHALLGVERGAYDFFSKPIETDELKVVLRRAYHLYRIEAENQALQNQSEGESVGGMLGTSEPMQSVFSAIRKVATTEVPILVLGESGTGKELIAREIHRASDRSKGPFVPINCGAIPEALLESELFGHEKGSFTGAHVQRKGRIETAQQGTLFLDEIGDLPQPLQVKLLRYLQERKIERVGGREEIHVDARVIAATNADLERRMRDGEFREDLYYRLGVVVIAVPPLRDRGEDVVMLSKAFLQKFSEESKKKVTGFTRQAVTAVRSYRWPGNVRELENRVRRAVIMCEGAKIGPADMELDTRFERFEGKGLREVREEVERELIQRVLSKNNGNVTRTAADLGVSRPTLHELLTKYEIDRSK